MITMMKSELLKQLYWMKLDTSALSDEAKPGYIYALNRVIEYVEKQPMEKDEASKILLGWIDFVNDPDASPNDPPYSDEEILEAMKMGAEVLKK